MRLIKRISNRTLKPLVKFHLRKTRVFNFRDISISVPPGVFHPEFFFSTKLMIGFLDKIDLSKKSILEAGSGSGLISIYMAKRNASVTASDISPLAQESTMYNAKQNNAPITFFLSDLFDSIPPQKFDAIIVNPPYFKKDPSSMEERAWYCGQNLEYFLKFFTSVIPYLHSGSEIFMVLSDECDIEGIAELANGNQLSFIRVVEKKTAWETGYIFLLKLMK